MPSGQQARGRAEARVSLTILIWLPLVIGVLCALLPARLVEGSTGRVGCVAHGGLPSKGEAPAKPGFQLLAKNEGDA